MVYGTNGTNGIENWASSLTPEEIRLMYQYLLNAVFVYTKYMYRYSTRIIPDANGQSTTYYHLPPPNPTGRFPK